MSLVFSLNLLTRMSIRRYGPIGILMGTRSRYFLRLKISNVATMQSTLVAATDGAHVRDIKDRTPGTAQHSNGVGLTTTCNFASGVQRIEADLDAVVLLVHKTGLRIVEEPG